MKHLGDITKINGAEVPVVDIVCGGSPCQDLSVAGKRAGLDGERSGLFMEQIRIIKEMRQLDRQSGRTGWMVRPRFMVWENVPGAFSSNKGEDFRIVLEETARVADPNAVIPRPAGKWTPSGAIMGDGWSIAWRVHDAQFWGVPQRRKRIALVADFGGASAPEILFERKGLSGDSEPGGSPGEGAAEGAEGGADPAICLQGNGIDRADTAGCNGAGWRRGGATPLTPSTGTACAVDVYTAGFKQGNGSRAAGIGYEQEKAPTLAAAESGTNQVPAVMAYGIDQQGGKGGANYSENTSPPICSDSHGTPHAVCYDSNATSVSVNILQDPITALDVTPCLSSGNSDNGQAMIGVMACDLRNGREQEVNGTLQAKPGGGISLNLNNVIRTNTGSQ